MVPGPAMGGELGEQVPPGRHRKQPGFSPGSCGKVSSGKPGAAMAGQLPSPACQRLSSAGGQALFIQHAPGPCDAALLLTPQSRTRKQKRSAVLLRSNVETHTALGRSRVAPCHQGSAVPVFKAQVFQGGRPRLVLCVATLQVSVLGQVLGMASVGPLPDSAFLSLHISHPEDRDFLGVERT